MSQFPVWLLATALFLSVLLNVWQSWLLSYASVSRTSSVSQQGKPSQHSSTTSPSCDGIQKNATNTSTETINISTTRTTTTIGATSSSTSYHYTRSNVIYGHVHMAKTAGTNLNGRLASQFERVCGHKGYSYDYHQFNARAIQFGKHDVHVAGGPDDSIFAQSKRWNRGRVPLELQQEIGFEDCDYISLESPWNDWLTLFPKRNTTETKGGNDDDDEQDASPVWKLELHVPCRDAVDHLMSSCNHMKKRFDCDRAAPNNITGNPKFVEKHRRKALWNEINECLYLMKRFSDNLLLRPPKPTATSIIENVKCFPHFPHEPYIQYMSHRLERRRYPVTPFFVRDSNGARNKSKECIWKDATLQQQVKELLVERVPWYQFCHNCMGSEQQLDLSSSAVVAK